MGRGHSGDAPRISLVQSRRFTSCSVFDPPYCDHSICYCCWGAGKRDAGCALTLAADRADASIATATTTHFARSTGREKGGRAFPPRSGKAFAAGSRCTNRRASLQKAPSVRLSSARAEGGESRKAAPDKGGLGKPLSLSLSLPSANQLIPIPHATPGNERSLLRRRPKPLLS